MDTPFTQPIQNSQTSTGFSFPVTETVAEPLVANQPLVAEQPVVPAPPIAPVANPMPPAYPVMPAPPQPQPQVVQPTVPSGSMFVSEAKPKSKTKDILMVGLLLILLAGAVFGFTKVRSLLSSAAEDGCAPIDIVEQDLTANSMMINFKTAEACKMQVAYGVDEILGLQMSEQILATDHRIKLSPLMPSTPYKYQIRHDETKYEPTRGFLTLPTSAAPTKAEVAPTRSVLPTSTVAPAKVVPTTALVPTGGTPTKGVGPVYTQEDFQLHFGSVDPRFDIDKNGIVNTRDWQLYSK